MHSDFYLHERLEAGRVAAARVEVCPPGAGAPASRFARGLREWLPSAFGHRGMATDSALGRARRDFVDAIDDLEGTGAVRLAHRVATARSLHDLWHLRVEVFALVAQKFDQLEAYRRLAVLNRHFPTRAPRSGFGGLDGPVR